MYWSCTLAQYITNWHILKYSKSSLIIVDFKSLYMSFLFYHFLDLQRFYLGIRPTRNCCGINCYFSEPLGLFRNAGNVDFVGRLLSLLHFLLL